MAGTKNINIVYNVDTQQIQVAKGIVDQAKVATDQLTQSTKNFSDQGAANSQKFASSITELKNQMQLLKTQIDLTNQSDTATLNQRIALYKEMQAQLDKYNTGLKDTQQQTQSVGTSFTSLYNTVRTVITAGILKELISVNLEMATMAGRVEGVSKAFNRIPNATLLLENLRSSTHGTVTDLELMQKTLMAQNYKIPLENLSTLLEFAAVKAQQTGQEVDHLVNFIVTGIGLRSIKRLDDLGFTANRVKEALGGATLQAASMGQVMDAVTKLMNEDLQKTGGYLVTSATLVENLKVSFNDLKVTLSQTLASSTFVEKLNDITRGATNLVKVIDVINKTGMSFNEASKAVFSYGTISKEAANTVSNFTKLHKDDTEAIDKEIERIEKLKKTNQEAIDSFKKVTPTGDIFGLFTKQNMTNDELQSRKDNQQYFTSQIDLLKQYKSNLDTNKKPQQDQIGLIEALDAKIKQLNEDLVKTTSRKNIIEIQVQIKQAEAEKADLLDPDRMARKLKEGFDKANDEIEQGIRSNSETILKSVSKASSSLEDNSLFKQLNKNMKKDINMFVDGLKDGMKEADQAAEDQERRIQHLLYFIGQQVYTNARQIANILIQNDVQQYDDRITALQDYYSNQETLAGTNTKRVQQLQKEESQKQKQLEAEKTAAQKKANIRRIEIDTAANVIKSILENGGIPWGLPYGGIAAAMGLLQIAAVNKFAKGVIDLKGPGTETSDSIPSLLSRGESVMTAEETRNSGNILRNIRAKKLNDNILDKLTITTEGITANFDDSRIVSELQKSRQPNIIKQFGVIYEAKEDSKNMRRIIRSKSFNG